MAVLPWVKPAVRSVVGQDLHMDLLGMDRAEVVLRGLALGDAFGETWFRRKGDFEKREPAAGMWPWTDDTAMAMGIYRVLARYGRIDQDALAAEFAAEYTRDPNRDYGPAMHDVLAAVHKGEPWRDAAGRQFGGQGSWGNGAAMRVAPVGAWFADDLDEVVVQARMSAEVTHTHPEAVAGAIAVAVATALNAGGGLELEEVIARVPGGDVRAGLELARRISFDGDPRHAGGTLGNGSRISAPDTVPFTIWAAARHQDDYVEALWATASAGGDIDTTCAIVGGIVAGRTGLADVPAEWLAAAEPISP
jgi:ADP-ribosylglycohydrolase